MRVTWGARVHCTKCGKEADCQMQFDGHYTAVIIPDEWELYTTADNDFEVYSNSEDDHEMLCADCQLLTTQAGGLAN